MEESDLEISKKKKWVNKFGTNEVYNCFSIIISIAAAVKQLQLFHYRNELLLSAFV